MRTTEEQKARKLESRFPDLTRSEYDIQNIIDTVIADFVVCNWDGAIAKIDRAIKVVEKVGPDQEAFDRSITDFQHRAVEMKKNAKEGLKKKEKYFKLNKAKSLTIDELLDLAGYYGIAKDRSDFLDSLFSGKRIVFNKKGYRIVRFRAVAGKGFLKIEGFEHLLFLEQEVNRGWIPLEKDVIEKVFKDHEIKAIKKFEEKIPESPEDILTLVRVLRDRSTPPEEIRKRLTSGKPIIKAEGQAATVNYYIEKDGIPLLHFAGFPSRIWIRLDNEAIAKAVRFAGVLDELERKVAEADAFNIKKLEDVVTANKNDVKQIPSFNDKMTKEDLDALMFINNSKWCVVISHNKTG